MFRLYPTEAASLAHQPRGPCMGSVGLKEEPSLHMPTAHHPYAQLQHHNSVRASGWMQPTMLDQAAVAR